MPWDSSTFKEHNKKLKGHSALVASTVANKVLSESGDEGKAIRIGNAAGNKARKKKSALKT